MHPDDMELLAVSSFTTLRLWSFEALILRRQRSSRLIPTSLSWHLPQPLWCQQCRGSPLSPQQLERVEACPWEVRTLPSQLGSGRELGSQVCPVGGRGAPAPAVGGRGSRQLGRAAPSPAVGGRVVSAPAGQSRRQQRGPTGSPWGPLPWHRFLVSPLHWKRNILIRPWMTG